MPNSDHPSRSEAFELAEDVSTNPSRTPTFAQVLEHRMSRRRFLGSAAGTAFAAAAAPYVFMRARPVQAAMTTGFEEISHGVDETHHVAPGYRNVRTHASVAAPTESRPGAVG